MCIVDGKKAAWISIHALREEGDGAAPGMQSVQPHFYPRPPRGGRPGCLIVGRQILQISIHALREEGDARCQKPAACPRYFYPRPPRGGRRGCTDGPADYLYFYPRPPRGGRPVEALERGGDLLFLSTPSARRATSIGCATFSGRSNFYPRPPRGGRPFFNGFGIPGYLISIHALREEGDPLTLRPSAGLPYFYPRPPRGGRQAGPRCSRCGRKISIHALREEGDPDVLPAWCRLQISIHALREEGDARRSPTASSPSKFLSTPSARRATWMLISSLMGA